MRCAVMNIEMITEFLGWCTVINYGFFFYGLVKVVLLRNWRNKVRAKVFGITDESSMAQTDYQFLGNYNIAIILFNLVPNIALKIMA